MPSFGHELAWPSWTTQAILVAQGDRGRKMSRRGQVPSEDAPSGKIRIWYYSRYSLLPSCLHSLYVGVCTRPYVCGYDVETAGIETLVFKYFLSNRAFFSSTILRNSIYRSDLGKASLEGVGTQLHPTRLASHTFPELLS